MELFSALWQDAASFGGGAALAFIVSLALGMVGLAAVYCVSAVVVLDRFARASRRPLWPFVTGGLVAVVGAITSHQVSRPELALQSWANWRVSLAGELPPVVGLVALAMGVVW